MRTNRADWIKRVERWQDSGLTAKEFASELGIKASTLTHWKWRLDKERREGQPSCAEASAKPAKNTRRRSRAVSPPLVELQLPAVQDSCFELKLACGHRLRVPTAFDESALLRLLAVLEEAA